MKRFLLVILVLSFVDSRAQVEGQDAQGNVTDLAAGSMFRSFDNRFRGIDGYPTLVKSYCRGEVFMINGKTVKYDSINLDVYSNDLLVKRDRSEAVFNRALAKGFSMEVGESALVFTKVKDSDGLEFFCQILADGKNKLLKHTSKTISGPTNTGAYSSGRFNSEFIEKSKLYLKKESGELVELKNKKLLVAQFPDHEEKISAFIKNNRLGMKEGELAKVVDYINTL